MGSDAKGLIQEMQTAGRRTKAAAMCRSIRELGAGIRDLFTTGSCDVCKGYLVRYEGPRGFVCAKGHAADRGASKRRQDERRAAEARSVDRSHALLVARNLHQKRNQELRRDREDDIL